MVTLLGTSTQPITVWWSGHLTNSSKETNPLPTRSASDIASEARSRTEFRRPVVQISNLNKCQDLVAAFGTNEAKELNKFLA